MKVPPSIPSHDPGRDVAATRRDSETVLRRLLHGTGRAGMLTASRWNDDDVICILKHEYSKVRITRTVMT